MMCCDAVRSLHDQVGSSLSMAMFFPMFLHVCYFCGKKHVPPWSLLCSRKAIVLDELNQPYQALAAA